MKIKNITNKPQIVNIVEYVGGREFTICVESKGCTDIIDAYIPDKSKLKGIFEILDEVPSPTVVETPSEISTIEESNTEEVPEEETPKVADIEEDKFVCDICGAEFASARSLASHKSRSHQK